MIELLTLKILGLTLLLALQQTPNLPASFITQATSLANQAINYVPEAELIVIPNLGTVTLPPPVVSATIPVTMPDQSEIIVSTPEYWEFGTRQGESLGEGSPSFYRVKYSLQLKDKNGTLLPMVSQNNFSVKTTILKDGKEVIPVGGSAGNHDTLLLREAHLADKGTYTIRLTSDIYHTPPLVKEISLVIE